MANVKHSQLTGSDIHEPKGVSTASDGAVYKADGLGSGGWSLPSATAFATMQITNNSTGLAVTGGSLYTTPGVFVEVTGAGGPWVEDSVEGFTFAIDHLKTTIKGRYYVSGYLTVKHSIGASIIGVKTCVNSTLFLERTPATQIKDAGKISTIAFSGITSELAIGDEVGMHIVSDTTGTVTIQDAVLQLHLLKAT